MMIFSEKHIVKTTNTQRLLYIFVPQFGVPVANRFSFLCCVVFLSFACLLYLVYPLLLVFLDCLFLIVSSVFSNVFCIIYIDVPDLLYLEVKIPYFNITHLMLHKK